MKKFTFINFAVGGAIMLPLVASAQNLGPIATFVSQLGGIIQLLIPIAFAAALLFFFWGVVKYIMAGGNEEAQADGKRIMIWGIIALFVMSSVWGLIAVLGGLVGVGQGGVGTTPKVI